MTERTCPDCGAESMPVELRRGKRCFDCYNLGQQRYAKKGEFGIEGAQRLLSMPWGVVSGGSSRSITNQTNRKPRDRGGL